MRAAIAYQLGLVGVLLAGGADAHENAEPGNSLIWQAVHYNRSTWIVPLLRAGANVNALQYIGSNGSGLVVNSVPDYTTPLMEALKQGPQMIRLLLEHGADPNAIAHDGQTPLIAAVQSKNVEGVKVLLVHRAEVNAQGKVGHTPLYYARKRKQEQIVALLQQVGAKE